MISDLAIIDPTAKIAADVSIGPWSIIGPEVEIGAGTWIGPHAVITGPTKIGQQNKIFQFASVGADPQDKKYQGERTFLEIGDRNVIRECCTLNRGTVQGGGVTRIGNDNLFMAYVHIAHDCIVGNQIVFANNASLAGHVTVQDYAILSGFAGVHQYCTIGAHSFIGGASTVTKDVLPFMLVASHNTVNGINKEGLRRRGFSQDIIDGLRRAYKIIYRQGLTVSEAIEELQTLLPECPEVSLLIDALQQSTRGIVR